VSIQQIIPGRQTTDRQLDFQARVSSMPVVLAQPLLELPGAVASARSKVADGQ
jgi:hypothetical protein